MNPESFPVEPQPAPASPRAPRSWWWAVGAMAVAGLVTLIALLVGDDGDQDRVATPAVSAGTSSNPATSPASSPAASAGQTAPGVRPPSVDRSTAVWPVAGTAGQADPVAAARAFAVDYLGFARPVVGAFARGDSRSGEVAVRPQASGPATTVLLRQLSGESTWSVLGAATENITVTRPAAGDTISSPVEVRGSALAFEGNVLVQVRQDGTAAPLGEAPVTGGGDVPRPFTGSIPYRAPSTAFGALVLLTHSAKDGSVWEAAVLRVRLGSGSSTAPAVCKVPAAEQPGTGEMAVTVYFTCDPESEAVPNAEPVTRVVPESTSVLRASMTALLAGPTVQETDAGFSSFFSSATARMLRGVSLTGGHAVVDFNDLRKVISGASSSAGSGMLLSELDATVFQFSTVKSVEYRLDGSCTDFNEWLQFGGCEPRTR